jgi:hypothetical protein
LGCVDTFVLIIVLVLRNDLFTGFVLAYCIRNVTSAFFGMYKTYFNTSAVQTVINCAPGYNLVS